MVWQPNSATEKPASMHKMPMKVKVKKEYDPIQSLYEQAVLKKATKIIADCQHPFFSEYEENSQCQSANQTA